MRLDPAASGQSQRDFRLIDPVACGFAARDELLALTPDQLAAMPSAQHRHAERTARLAYLAPDIIRAILDGRQPKSLSAPGLARLGSLPLAWREQRALLGFASA